MVMRGHETLTRTVGKRRRLSMREFVEQASQSDAAEETPRSDEVGSMRYGAGSDCVLVDSFKVASKELFKGEDGSVEWVDCPVCAKTIKADLINNHLDFCLLGEAKFMSNQLSISKFCSVSSVGFGKDLNKRELRKEDQHYLIQSQDIATDTDSLQSKFLRETVVDTGNSLQGIDSRESEGLKTLIFSGEEKKEFFLGSKLVVDLNGSKLDALSKEKEYYNAIEIEKSKETTVENCDCSCHILSTSEVMQKCEDDKENKDLKRSEDAVLENLDNNFEQENKDLKRSEDGDLDSLYILETKIVGRKFYRGGRVEKGLKIAILRDHDNPKDSNAIMIVPAEDKEAIPLGHLPRELAFHLSYLLDNSMLQVQGCIIAVPETAIEAVPLKLLCKRSLVGAAEVEEFEKHWKQILCVTERMAKSKISGCSSVQPRYQQNFIYLLQAVLEYESCVLNDEEKTFLGSFSLLSGDAQRLFIRLYQRKGPWFRVGDIHYADISNVISASQELLAAGYLTAADGSKITDTLETLNVAELKQLILKGRWMKKTEMATAKKDDLLKCIISAANEKHHTAGLGSSKPGFNSLVIDAIGACVCISNLAALLFWRLERLFFLNGEQDLSAFLLVDIGRIKYPTYSCKRTQCIFASRKDLLAYEKALEVAQAMDMALEVNDHNSILQLLERAYMQLLDTSDSFGNQDMFIARFSAAWVCTTIVTVGVSVLERDHKFVEAVTLLRQLLKQSSCPGRRGYWTIRLSIDLEHLGCKEESLEAAETGLKDPRIRTGDRIALQRRIIRLSKPPRRWKKPPFADAMARKYKEVCFRGRPLNRVVGVKSRFYGFDGEQCSVEELALQFYAKEENGQWEGIHSEGGIWMTLFGLLMWDVLFADVPNVFLTPFQNAPLDLDTDAFYPSREASIKTRLSMINNGEACRILAGVWAKWYGTLCRGVNWDRHSLAELQKIASCIGGPGLASVCRLLAEDYAGWTGGMPDLLLWRTKTDRNGTSSVCNNCSCQRSTFLLEKSDSLLPGMGPVEGEAKLVEVKGPRDNLSEQQHAWILVLMDAGICVEVCKIHEESEADLNVAL